MLVIVGLVVMLIAVIVAVVGLLSNAGPEHPLSPFSVLGYHVTGSTGTLFLFGIVVGAVALIGLSALLVGTRRVVLRAHDVRRANARFQRETAFINRDRDGRLEHEPRARGRSL
jgi:amino acid transporter